MNEDQKRVQAKAFNEWMRLSIEEPERFQNQYQSMRAFEKAIESGVEPDYGSVCVEYLEKLMVDVIEKEVMGAETVPA